MMQPQWGSSKVEINGSLLNIVHAGTEGKQAMVLVHGFSDNGLCWQREAQALQDDYDIRMPDMRGHGASERVRLGESFDMVADLAGMIESLGIKEPVVAGHSMGAAITFEFAARYPDIPTAIILEDPPWFNEIPEHFKRGDDQPSDFGRWAENLQNQSLAELLDECHQEHPEWPEMTALRWCEAKKQLDPKFLLAGAIPLSDWRVTLAKITCPALLITANPALGGLVTPEMANQAIDIKANLRVAYFPDTGHHIRFARHEEYLQAVRKFLS
jgi:N-formylmaleamate deformylase